MARMATATASSKASPKDSAPHHWVLTLSCPDVPGVVHGVASFLLVTGCTIVDSQQYGDPDTKLFFMRVHFVAQEEGVDLLSLNGGFSATAAAFRMSLQIHDVAVRMPATILVSHLGHRLHDL